MHAKLAHVGHLSSFIVEIKKFGSNNDLSLKEIREGERFNLIVKVLHISEVIKDEWMLFVWDGTDAPPLPIETKLEDETENPLPLQLEPCPVSRDILCTFPAVGTVLRVIVDQGDEKLGLHLVKAGRWVKLSNIKCEVRDGLWRGVLMPFTKLRYLPDDDDLIIHCQRIYDERVASKWRRMPLLSFPWPSYITETGYPDVPFVTLMNVLNYTEVLHLFSTSI
ncbi:unnamed protein product [Ilex paraguariensis]|uniref:Protection of telomeres protein 1 ssDNA-binding domain-containing protein n=1 Tax=Ilex paraguariensis TaxID=185542 RepID=A0ABC8S8Q9_9AQUA